jgi:hypothetical protein
LRGWKGGYNDLLGAWLRGKKMSDELLPPGNTSVFQLLSIFASAFATAGATLVLTGGGYVLGIAALAFAVKPYAFASGEINIL